MKFKFALVATALFSASVAHANSIDTIKCEYNETLNNTAVQLITSSNLSGSATMTADSAAPSGSYSISTNTITNTYSGNLDCSSKAFVVTDGSTTYSE